MRDIPVLRAEEIRPTCRYANHIQPPIDQAWAHRSLSDIELIYVARGEYSYERPEADDVLIVGGSVLCILPGELHSLVRRDRKALSDIRCIHCELLPGCAWVAGDYRFEYQPALVTDCSDDLAMGDLFRKTAIAFRGHDLHRDLLLETMLCEIWLRLSQRWTNNSVGRISHRVREMMEYLRDNLLVPVSRRDLAEAFNLTPQHVNALFKKELGSSPTQFVLRERCLLAYRLIRDEGLSVKEAAARTGFNDPFYFSRVFTRIMHIPPSRVQ